MRDPTRHAARCGISGFGICGTRRPSDSVVPYPSDLSEHAVPRWRSPGRGRPWLPLAGGNVSVRPVVAIADFGNFAGRLASAESHLRFLLKQDVPARLRLACLQRDGPYSGCWKPFPKSREVTMTSPAQMKSNAENAKKSTGPRTVEGKERARMNAVKHGMTARVVLLPDENIAEFKLRMTGIVEDLRPKSGLESVLAERVAYSFVRSDRASRASGESVPQSAYACARGGQTDAAGGSRPFADAVSAAAGPAGCSSVRGTTRRIGRGARDVRYHRP